MRLMDAIIELDIEVTAKDAVLRAVRAVPIEALQGSLAQVSTCEGVKLTLSAIQKIKPVHFLFSVVMGMLSTSPVSIVMHLPFLPAIRRK